MRAASTAFFATLAVVAVVGGGALAFQNIAPERFAAALRNTSHAPEFLSSQLATANDQLAAASALPWLDAAGSTLFSILCPIFRDCQHDDAIVQPTTQQPRAVQPASQKVATSTAPQPRVATPQPDQQTVIQQPVIERIREVQIAGVNASYVDTRIAALATSLQRQFDAMANANATSFRSVSSSGGSSPTSVAASIVTGTITNAIDSAVGEFLDLTTNTLVATNATTTTLYVSATSTTVGLRVSSLDCSSLGNGGTLTTDASGNVVCAADDGGSGSVGGSDTQVQFNDGGSLGGDSGLTYNKTADRLTTVNASTTNLSASYASTTALVAGTSILGTVTSGTWQGTAIGDSFLTKTGDWTGTLDGYEASALLASGFATTSANYWQTTRNFFATTSADYWETQQTARTADDLTNNSIEDLNDVAAMTENYGDLFAWNGSAWADFATSSLAIALSDTTGILATAKGGTGWGAIAANAIVLGNGTGAVATTSAGTNGQVLALSGGVPTWVATTTFSSGLTYLNGNVTLDATGAWSGTFDGLEGATYLANSFATTSADVWKTERNFFSTTSADYFLAQNQGAAFSTTSAIYFVNASTTIPKTYTANTYTGLQTFGSASSTLFSTNYASSTLYFGAGLANCASEFMLTWTDGRFGCESDTAGGSSFSYPFPGDATTTKLTFSGGLLSLASTTIGAGGQTTGLTISGGATTTLNAYFASTLRVDGITTLNTQSKVDEDSTGADFYLDGGSNNDNALRFLELGTLRWRLIHLGSSADAITFLDEESDQGVSLAQDGTSWTAASDIRLKNNIEELSVLDRLDGFRAVTFDWRANDKHDLGVIAQELYPLFPEIVIPGNNDATTTPGILDGSAWQVMYDKIGAVALQGVKELNLKLEDLATTTPDVAEGSFTSRFFSSLFARLSQWFADAQNGITDFFARTIHTDELCVGSVCVTEDQFMQIFSPNGMPAAAGSVTSPPAENPTESEASATSTPTESVTPTKSTPPTEEVEDTEESDISEVPAEENANATEAAAPQEPPQSEQEIAAPASEAPAEASVSETPPADAPSAE